MQSKIAQITEVPAGIERFARQLVVAWKAVLLYPPASAIPTETSEIAAATLREIVAADGEFSLSVQKSGLSWSGVPLKAQNSSFESFAVELYQRSLAEIRFHADADRASIATFLSVIATDSADIQAAGGIEASLTNAGLQGISVLEARVAIVDADVPTAAIHEPSVAEVDSLVSSALSGGTEDLRRLVRMVGEANAAHAWLAASSTKGFDPRRAGDRVVELAQAAMRLPVDERSRFQQGIGDALLSLPEDQTAALLRDRLLPCARKDAAAATIVAAIGLDDLCRALVSPGEPSDENDLASLGAAIRNLGVALGDSEGVAEAAAAAMMDAGFSEQATSVVFSLCAPTQVLAAPAGLPAEGPAQSPADQVMLMLGAVEPSESNGVADLGLLELRTNAESGTSDSEVLAALVTLVELDPTDERIGHAADLIEGLMALVVKRGEVDAAAQAVDVLTRVSERSDLPEAVSSRIASAIASMSKPSDLRTLVDLARSASGEDLDREAAARMLEAIGDKAIEPMLEVLADEEDMATRKRLVEVLSSIADAHIPQIASHLGDSRWYFVRNVVAVLGSARRSATLPYLQRTIRHGDARVRRETIRAIRQLPDRLATEMLVAALDDDDAQNVQLAAQSIGMRNDSFAVPGLATLAGGEGRGNREIAVRLEAVEALARIGSADALRVLDEVAGRRGLLSGGRAREVARAAETAAARLRSGARS